MPETYVHPTIVEKCFSLLGSEEYESAVIQAFKAIEVSLRNKINAPKDQFGERLFKTDYSPENGMLTDMSLPKSERFAFYNYISGAFSFYRNPSTHREVELDFISAFDKIVVASDLLKAIDDSVVNERK